LLYFFVDHNSSKSKKAKKRKSEVCV